MTNTEFLKELKMLINSQRVKIREIELNHEYISDTLKERLKSSEAMLDKLEQDYFHKPTINVDINLSNIKKFDVDGNLINEGEDEDGNLINEGEKEMSTTEQVEKGLLKIFNKYVLDGENKVGMYEFDYDKYSIGLCQIADRLLQIESDRKIRKGFFDNCVIS